MLVRFLRRVKKFFVFLFFLLILVAGLITYSLYEEESYKKSCSEFGLECSRGLMERVVEKSEEWFTTWLDQLKSADFLKKTSQETTPLEEGS